MNALTASLPSLLLHLEQFTSSWFAALDPLLPEPAPKPARPTHVLHPQETLGLETRPGQRVTCLDGCVLLQYQGRPRGDIILVRGETHACEGGARIAILAFVATTLRIG